MTVNRLKEYLVDSKGNMVDWDGYTESVDTGETETIRYEDFEWKSVPSLYGYARTERVSLGTFSEYERKIFKSVPLTKVPNDPFKATMKITDFARGRSKANFSFTRDDGTTWYMRATEFMQMLPFIEIKNSTFTATFKVNKRGANYSLEYYAEEDNG